MKENNSSIRRSSLRTKIAYGRAKRADEKGTARESIRSMHPFFDDIINSNTVGKSTTILSGNKSIKDSFNKVEHSASSIAAIGNSTVVDMLMNMPNGIVESKKNGVMFKSQKIEKLKYEYNKKKNTKKNSENRKSLENIFDKKLGAFDLEIVGGRNFEGDETFDGITEFAMVKTDESGAVINKDAIKGLFGISESTGKKHIEEVGIAIEQKRELSVREGIIFNYFSKMGNTGTRIINDKDSGLSVIKEINADTPEKIEDKFEVFKKGIEKFVEIGKFQNKKSNIDPATGLRKVDLEYAKFVKTVKNEKTIQMNGTAADIPWINKQTGIIKSRLDKNKYKKFLSEAGLSIDKQTLDISETDSIDARSIVTEFRNTHDIEDWDNVVKMTGGLGVGELDSYNLKPGNNLLPFSLEAITKVMFGENFGKNSTQAPHTAEYDAAATAMLYTGDPKNGVGSLIDNLKKAMDGTPALDSFDILPNSTAFVGRKSESSGAYSSKHSLSFSLSKDGTIKTSSGFDISNGEVTDIGYTRPVFNKGAFTVGKTKRISPSDSMFKKMIGDKNVRKSLPDILNPDGLYVTEIIPILPEGMKDMVQDDMSEKRFMVTTSKHETEQILIDNAIPFAEKDSNGVFKAIKETKEEFAKVNPATGSRNGYYSPEEIIKNRANDLINGRSINNVDNNIIRKQKQYSKAVQKIEDGFVDMTTPEKKKMVLKLLSNQNIANAKKVSGGKSGKAADFDIEELSNIINMAQNGGSKPPDKRSVNKFIHSYDYIKGRVGISDRVIDFIEKNDTGSGDSDFKFNYILKSLEDDASYEISDSIQELSKIQNNGDDYFIESGQDNKYYLDMNLGRKKIIDNKINNLPTAKNMSGKTSIQLGNNASYNLLNKISDTIYDQEINAKDLSKEQFNTLQVQLLKKISKNLSLESNDFSNLGEKMDNDNDPLRLAQTLIESMESARENNQKLGRDNLQYQAKSKNVINKSKIYSYLDGLDNDNIDKRIRSISNNMPEYIGDADKSVNTSIEKLVNKFLSPDFGGLKPKEYFKSFGHGEKEAINLSRLVEDARLTQIDNLTKVMTPVLEEGGSLRYDVKTGKFEVEINNKIIDLSNTPRVKVDSGIVYTKVGNVNTALESVVDVSNVVGLQDTTSNTGRIVKKGLPSAKPELIIKSTLTRVYDKQYSFDNLRKSNSLEDSVAIWSKQIEKNARSVPSLGKFNKSAALKSYSVDVNDVIKAFSFVAKNDKTFIDRVIPDGEAKEKLIKEISKENFDVNNLGATYRDAIQKYIQPIMKELVGKGAWENDIANGLSGTGKDTSVSEGIMVFGDIASISFAGGAFNNIQRPVYNSATNMYEYRKSNMENSRAAKTGKIRVGSNTESEFDSKFLHRKIEGTEDTVSDSFRAKTLFTSQGDLEKMIDDHFLHDGISYDDLNEQDKFMYDRLSNVNVYEQENVVDLSIAEMLDKSDMQTLSADSKKFVDSYDNKNMASIEDNVLSNWKKVQPVFKVDKDGKISLEYKKLIDVERGDPLGLLEGYGSNKPSAVKKNESLFGFGFFSRSGGEIISENEINKMLKEKDVSNQLDAINLIREKFDMKYYVKSKNQSQYVKLAMGGVEKGMTSSFGVGLGELDKDVKKYLEDSGNKDMIGNIASKDQIKTKIINDFNPLNAGKKFKTKEDLEKAILKERYSVNDRLFEEILGGKVSIVTSQNKIGHANKMSVFSGVLNNIMDANDKKSVYKDLKKAKVFNNIDVRFEDGKIIFPNSFRTDSDINIGNFNNMVKEKYKDFYDEEDGFVGTKEYYNGKLIGAITTEDITHSVIDESLPFSSLADSPRISALNNEIDEIKKLKKEAIRKNMPTKSFNVKILKLQKERKLLSQIQNEQKNGQKITNRSMGILSQGRVNSNFIDKMATISEETGIDTDDIMDLYTVPDVLSSTSGRSVKEEYRGKPIIDSYLDNMLHNQYFTSGSSDILKRDDIFEGVYSDYSVSKGIKDTVMRNGAMSRERAESIYSLKQTVLSSEYNASSVKDNDFMSKHGFKKLNYNDLEFSVGDDANEIVNSDKSLYNKSVMLDFGDVDGHNLTIAKPYTNTPVVGDKIIPNEIDKAAIFAVNSKKKLDVADKADKRKAQEVFNRSYESLKEMIQKGTSKDESYINHYRMEASMRGELKMIPENSTFKKRAKFMGATIESLNKKGIYINANVAGEESFEKMGMFSEEVMKIYNIDNKEDMMKHLETNGIVTLTSRSPEMQKGSIHTSVTYLDRGMSGDKLGITPEEAKSFNGDIDGDQGAVSILTVKDKNGKGHILGTKPEDDKMLKQVKASILFHGKDEGENLHDYVMDSYAEDSKKAIASGNTNSKMMTDMLIDNKMYPTLSTEPSIKDIMSNKISVAEFKDKYNVNDTNDLDEINNVLGSIEDGADRDKYGKALGFNIELDNYRKAQMAKVSKGEIGPLNQVLFENRQALENFYASDLYENNTILSSDASSARMSINQLISQHLENDVISKKKGDTLERINVGGEMADLIKTIRNPKANDDDRLDSIKSAGELFTEVFGSSKIGAEAKKDDSIMNYIGLTKDTTDEEVQKAISDEFFGKITKEDIGENAQKWWINQANAIGNNSNGISPKNIPSALEAARENQLDFSRVALEATGLLDDGTNEIINDVMEEASNTSSGSKYSMGADALEDGTEWLNGTSTTGKAKEAVTELLKKKKPTLSKKTLVGAGLVGLGTMLYAGVITGARKESNVPADMQGQDVYEDGQANFQQESLLQGTKNINYDKTPIVGYNIRLKSQVSNNQSVSPEEAVQRSFQSEYNGVNMNINVSNKFESTNSVYTEKLLSSIIDL